MKTPESLESGAVVEDLQARVMEQLAAHREAGLIQEIDLQLARFMARRFPGDAAVALAAALASNAVSNGHVCASLGRLPDWMVDLPSAPGSGSDWASAIGERLTRLEATGDGAVPLVLDRAGRLYLRRLLKEETAVAEALRRRALALPSAAPDCLADTLQTAFNFDPSPDQARAVVTAALRRLCVISGGPGTGKTSVVAAILRLLSLAFGMRYEHMVTTAPTGKAVTRIRESLRDVPVRVVTLHRLLGLRRGVVSSTASHVAPLPYRLVLVDEVSMVNQSLLAKLLDRLAADTRLVLLGDRYQLASVEAGAVLASLCDSAGPPSEGWKDTLTALGLSIPEGTEPGTASTAVDCDSVTTPLADCVVELKRNYRFAAEAPIGRAAQAIRDGNGEALMRVLEAGDPSLNWRALPRPEAMRGALLDRWSTHMGAPRSDRGVDHEALAAQPRFRILCAHRGGPGSVDWVNRVFEYGRETWYAGRPVLINRNEPGLDLYNGDLGVCLKSEEGLLVHFPDSGLALPPGQLPPNDPAYALTVHKSQGSEFDQVLVILPPRPSPVVTRELLYTALTRARRGVEVWATREVLMHAVGCPTERESGLTDRLLGSPSIPGAG